MSRGSWTCSGTSHTESSDERSVRRSHAALYRRQPERPVTRTRQNVRPVLLAMVVGLWPFAVSAQFASGPSPTTAECHAMIAAIGLTNPTGGTWFRVGECGARRISTLRSALWRAHTSTDSLNLLSMLGTAARVRHSQIFGRSRDVATDPTSTKDARLMSLLVLLSQYHGSYVRPNESWATTVSAPGGIGCRLMHITDSFQLQAGALPPDSLARIASTAEMLMLGTYSAVVKDLAACIRNMISEDFPLTVPIRAISLTHVCGDRFRVTNSGAFDITVSYSVQGTNETGDLSVGAGLSVEFFTDATGTVRLAYMNREILQLRNGGMRC